MVRKPQGAPERQTGERPPKGTSRRRGSRRAGERETKQMADSKETLSTLPGYVSLTSNTHRLPPLSLDSLRETWTDRPKMASKFSF